MKIHMLKNVDEHKIAIMAPTLVVILLEVVTMAYAPLSDMLMG